MKRTTSRIRPRVRLVSNSRSIDISAVSKLLASVGMRKRNAQAMRRAIAASSDVAVAHLGDDLIGFGRMISDRTYYGTIWDVAVREDLQGRGIGRQIMKVLLAQARKRRLYMIGLVSAGHNRAFYERLGFKFFEDVHAMTFELQSRSRTHGKHDSE